MGSLFGDIRERNERLIKQFLKYKNCGDFNGLVLSKNPQTLSKPNGLLEVAENLIEEDGRWLNSESIQFDSGAIIKFATLSHPNDHYKFATERPSLVGVDEEVEISKRQVDYFFMRCIGVEKENRGYTN